LLAEPVPRTRLEIGSGERYELVVDLSGDLGKTLELKSYSTELGLDGMDFDDLDKADFTIMTLVVGDANANPAGPLPATLSTLPDATEQASDGAFSLTITMDIGGVMAINGKTMAMDRIDKTVFLGDTEVWSITNRSEVPHPVHIHDVQFRVISRNGGPAHDYEAGWKDTVIVHPEETVRVRHTFEDFADPDVPYMYHCHILEHEDRGMMGQFLVIER
jgi:FtsP/CotA-like multicopper oxidase with cupredoxin domain